MGYQGWYLLRSQRPYTWLKAVEELIETLLYLTLSYQLGPWQWLPIALWWGLLALFAGLTMRRLWPLRILTPVEASSPGSRWRGIRLIPTLLVLGWTIFWLR